MKKIKITHPKSKLKNRSSSVLNWTNPSKLNHTKIKNFNPNNTTNYFRLTSAITSNTFYNPTLTKNKNQNETYNSLFKDLQSMYNKQNLRQKQKIASARKFNIKDIDIIKAKENTDLLSKVTNYLDQKKEKISIVDRLKEPKLDNLKKLLHESKSEENILTKTFSTKFIGNEEYNTLSKVFGKGHSKKIGVELKKEDDKYEDLYYLKAKEEVFNKYNLNPNMTLNEKKILNSISHKNKKNNNIGVSSKINYYTNQFDSFKALQINKNIYNELILKQEKEQIKQFLKNELKNEQQILSIKLMPKVHTIELSKYKKDTQETNEMNGQKPIVNSISDLSKIPRANLFQDYNSVYMKNISKFLSTPTCRIGSKMISYLDEDSNNYKILLFGGQNIVRLEDLWECSIITPNKLEKKYIWKKVSINGDNPLPRSGHSMIYYRENLIIFGGVIEEKGGVKIHEDLLCYDINEKKFSIEMCMNKFSVTWRSYHIAEILGQFMFIYGGGDEKGNILAEPWALDLERMRWEPAKFNTEILPRRKFHCSCQVFPPQKKYHSKFTLFKVYTEPGLFNSTKILVEGIYMFGGVDENLKCCNDVLIIKRGKPLQLFKAITKGMGPIPRCECTMDFFEKLDVVIIYGGRNEHSNYGPYFNDMFFLDVETLNWFNIELNYNKNFYTRGKHCSCIVENELIIFGGANEKFLLKSDLLICNLDIGESTKIVRANKFFKTKAKTKKDKNDINENEPIDNNDNINMNLNHDNALPFLNSAGEDNDSNARFSLPLLNREKLMQLNLNHVSKLKKDTKILMNQKIQTSKNFFLDFPKQKNELQEKFKEIDSINFNSTDSKKIQEIIKNTFLEFTSQ